MSGNPEKLPTLRYPTLPYPTAQIMPRPVMSLLLLLLCSYVQYLCHGSASCLVLARSSPQCGGGVVVFFIVATRPGRLGGWSVGGLSRFVSSRLISSHLGGHRQPLKYRNLQGRVPTHPPCPHHPHARTHARTAWRPIRSVHCQARERDERAGRRAGRWSACAAARPASGSSHGVQPSQKR
ncbi:uncharacterized protein J3D65DRAFT_642545 [Phyllosticta citribraziliensis]|uniref:Uncharacterized protein n=1 Tax=Phyllosticta citribraziliensis TaxID=989973 RepID=A0ABR1L5A8_9PEZI